MVSATYRAGGFVLIAWFLVVSRRTTYPLVCIWPIIHGAMVNKKW